MSVYIEVGGNFSIPTYDLQKLIYFCGVREETEMAFSVLGSNFRIYSRI